MHAGQTARGLGDPLAGQPAPDCSDRIGGEWLPWWFGSFGLLEAFRPENARYQRTSNPSGKPAKKIKNATAHLLRTPYDLLVYRSFGSPLRKSSLKSSTLPRSDRSRDRSETLQ